MASTLADQRTAGLGDSVFLTVREVLELPNLRGAKLLTSPAVADSRLAKRTSVQELPYESFVRPDELVMTTAIGLEDDPGRFAQLVVEVARAGAACLAVAVGPHVHEIPPTVVATAERVDLPLVQLPWELRFSEVTELILEHALAQQNDILRRSEQISQVLTDIVLKGGELTSVCRSVAELIRRRVTITQWGEVVGASDEAHDGEKDVAMGPSIPITTGAFELGALKVERRTAPLSELDMRILRHGATAAALIMVMERAVAEAETRGQREFLSSVLHGVTDLPRTVERRAAALGIDPRGPYAVGYLMFDSETAQIDGSGTELGRWALDRVLAARRSKALKTWFGREVALLLPVATMGGREQLRCLLGDVATIIVRQAPSACVTAGLGSGGARLSGVAQSFREAVIACRLGRSLNGPGSMTDYRELGAYPALLEATVGTRSAAAFQALQERYLGPILDYERHNRLPLVETLAALFSNNGNVSATARELNINRQSLLYRLEKIESLAGVDLSIPASRFALELATRALRVQELPFVEPS